MTQQHMEKQNSVRHYKNKDLKKSLSNNTHMKTDTMLKLEMNQWKKSKYSNIQEIVWQ